MVGLAVKTMGPKHRHTSYKVGVSVRVRASVRVRVSVRVTVTDLVTVVSVFGSHRLTPTLT